MSEGPTLASAVATAGPYVVGKLREFDARLAEVAPRVLASAVDDDAVHDLRVALRRARTMLEVARPLLGRFRADEVRRSLRDLQRTTGLLRDEEVLRELVGSLGVEHPDVARWLQSRALRERRLRTGLARALRDGRLEHGRRLLSALVAFRVKPTRDRKLLKFARRAVEDARRDVDHHRAARADDVEELHRLRIAYKRLRYTVEAFADILPSDLGALAQPAARFQSKLGELHDADVAMASVRRSRLLSDEARRDLLAALTTARAARMTAYAKEVGTLAIAPTSLFQEAGTESLRKISTR